MSQFARYAAISGLTWLIDLALFLILYRLASVPVALLASRIAAGAFAFMAHKGFSFSSRTPITRGEVAGYIGLALFNYALSVVFISAFPTDTWEHAGLSKVAVEILIFLVNFLLLRRLFVRS